MLEVSGDWSWWCEVGDSRWWWSGVVGEGVGGVRLC